VISLIVNKCYFGLPYYSGWQNVASGIASTFATTTSVLLL